MKNNAEDLVIIYDSDCPMCNWYTSKFTKHGFLGENGREPYQKAGPYTKIAVDMDRARNHIALLDKNSGEVKYGYDSLLEVIGRKISWLRNVGSMGIVRNMFMGIYDFISYNRKIIAPAPAGFLSCIPDKKPFLRMVFILLCMAAVEVTAGNFFKTYFYKYTRFNDVPFRESVMFLTQLVVMLSAAALLRVKNLYDYAGHLAFISLAGGLFLALFHMVVLMLNMMQLSHEIYAPLALGSVVTWMFLEHKRRLRISGFPRALSWIWLGFRIGLFFVVF